MTQWSPDDPENGQPEPDDDDSETPVAFVATQFPVPLRVEKVHDDRTPEGMVCMGSFLNDRLIARSAVPPEMISDIEDRDAVLLAQGDIEF